MAVGAPSYEEDCAVVSEAGWGVGTDAGWGVGADAVSPRFALIEGDGSALESPDWKAAGCFTLTGLLAGTLLADTRLLSLTTNCGADGVGVAAEEICDERLKAGSGVGLGLEIAAGAGVETSGKLLGKLLANDEGCGSVGGVVGWSEPWVGETGMGEMTTVGTDEAGTGRGAIVKCVVETEGCGEEFASKGSELEAASFIGRAGARGWAPDSTGAAVRAGGETFLISKAERGALFDAASVPASETAEVALGAGLGIKCAVASDTAKRLG